VRFAAGNAQNVGARPDQQDAFGFSDPQDESFLEHGGFLGVVADGMGGLANGSEASHAAVRAFLRAYEGKSLNESVREALGRALHEANRAVLAVAEKASSSESVGTTLAAAAIVDDSLQWISAGDSRIYVLRDGHLTQVTADHIYAKELNEQVAVGKISRAEAESHSERAFLTATSDSRTFGKLTKTFGTFLCNRTIASSCAVTGCTAPCPKRRLWRLTKAICNVPATAGYVGLWQSSERIRTT
jgi:PPM family protein phosphatase